MKLLSKGAGVLGGTVAAAAALAAVAASGVGLASTRAPAPGSVVIVDCHGARVKPGSVNHLCGDNSDYLSGLRWTSWKNVAYGSGTEHVNDCTPTCAAGTVYAYPVLLTAWRAEPRPGHPGQRYFSRLTEIHTGRLTRPGAARLPLTFTWHLAPSAP
jgi:hypothetical protein